MLEGIDVAAVLWPSSTARYLTSGGLFGTVCSLFLSAGWTLTFQRCRTIDILPSKIGVCKTTNLHTLHCCSHSATKSFTPKTAVAPGPLFTHSHTLLALPESCCQVIEALPHFLGAARHAVCRQPVGSGLQRAGRRRLALERHHQVPQNGAVLCQ